MINNENSHSDWHALNIEGFMALIGPLLRLKKSDGTTVYALQTTEQHKNAMGLVHGGVITSLLDQTIAVEAWNAADRQPTVTVHMDTRFLSPAKVGDFLEARVKIRHTTRTMMFVDAEIGCGSAVVASATAIMKTSQKRDKKP